MPRTLGYHLVKTCYGRWLPGDDRGHWSDVYDEQIGFYEPHMLHAGDPVRLRMAQERQLHPPVTLDADMTEAVALSIGSCVEKSEGSVVIRAGAIHFSHMHLLIDYSDRDIDITAKWLADQTTKAVHRMTSHQSPVWARGRWRAFVFDRIHWGNAMKYIEDHNLRIGLRARPYPWIV